jgi:dimethylargininase
MTPCSQSIKTSARNATLKSETICFSIPQVLFSRTFDKVFVRRPGKNYPRCLSDNPEKGTIDLHLALEQHRTYVSILKENGVSVEELNVADEFPDSCFMQDPALLTKEVLVVGKFGVASRRGEEAILEKEIGQLLPTRHIKGGGTLEGGDILMTHDSIFVGVSGRTNRAGIEQLAALMPKATVTPVKTPLNHLMSACSYLTDRSMAIAPDFFNNINQFSGYKLVEIHREEMYASNMLYLGERRVAIPSGFPKALKSLEESDFKPVPVDVSEFRKGDGAVTCLSLPWYKTI